VCNCTGGILNETEEQDMKTYTVTNVETFCL